MYGVQFTKNLHVHISMFDSTHIELINLFARRAGRWLEEASGAQIQNRIPGAGEVIYMLT